MSTACHGDAGDDLNKSTLHLKPNHLGEALGARLHKARVLFLPLAFASALAVFTLFPLVQQNMKTLAAFVGASAALCLWCLFLFLQARRTGRTLAVEIQLKPQHYLQACAQTAFLIYWGWYWPPAYSWLPFMLAQLLFAYAFDLLLNWSRRDTAALGFGQFPIVISINLFLWFKPDWFVLQFGLLALGLIAKEFLRWNKDGRASHIFNPSSFPLAVFSVVLLATGTTGITWGQEIATTQFYPPHIYLFLFLAGIPGQFFFGVTSMTMSAVLTTFVFGRVYFAVTGIYFFYDSFIPISVFLGMHLLFTDPATAPRTELGRILYGIFYGLSTVALYQWLGGMGLPTFYDKLLQVPVMNLSVRGVDRLARSRFLQRFDPAALGRSLVPRTRNLAYISIWALAFAGLSLTQSVGDDHPGQWLPFWTHACDEGRAYACPYLADMEVTLCNRGSGWACNEAGLMHIALSRSGEDRRRLNPTGALEVFRRGCDLSVEAACQNLTTLAAGQQNFVSGKPVLQDYPILLRGSKGEVEEREPAALLALACRQGWPDACSSVAQDQK
ncbi:MAG: hypothetical protein ABI824_11305 [Acidobacteriota bacterium]